MGRILNRTFDYHTEQQPEQEMRQETRSDRIMPVMVVPVVEDGSQPEIITGFTRDLSISGMALLTTQRIEATDLLVVIGDNEGRVIMEATRCHGVHKGYGCYQTGIKLDKVLKDADYSPLLEYINAVESMQ